MREHNCSQKIGITGVARFPARLPENDGARATMLERSQSGTRKMTRRNDRERGNAYRARGRAQVPLISMQNAGLARGARVVPLCPPFTRLGIVHRSARFLFN